MRNNYYDSDWKWVKEQSERGEPISPPQAPPYGAVYGGQSRYQGQPALPQGQVLPAEPVREQVNQVVITRQDQLNTTPAMRPLRPRPRSRRRSGWIGCLVCLLLLCALSVTVVYLQGGFSLPELSMEGIWGLWQEPDPEGDYYSTDWTEELKNTTIRLAPLGDGTVLTIDPPMAIRLSAQEIYDMVNPSVVAVQVDQGDNYYSMGSGVIFSEDGYIVTNAHVIAGGSRAEVLFSDGSVYTASLIGYDSAYDLAVLKVSVTGLPAAEFGDSDNVRVGDVVYAIGNPLGLELRGTLTDGIISAIDRDVSAENGSMTLLQTTAALNSGNSGGALINEAGQVVGITNMKMMSDEETIEGLGFAIPTRSVKEVVDQLIAQGYYDDGIPLLGVKVYTYNSDGVTPSGAYVSEVTAGSSAERQGLRVGDIITAANGKTVTNIGELLAVKETLNAGDTMVLSVWRNGERLTVELTLMTRYQMEHPDSMLRPVG